MITMGITVLSTRSILSRKSIGSIGSRSCRVIQNQDQRTTCGHYDLMNEKVWTSSQINSIDRETSISNASNGTFWQNIDSKVSEFEEIDTYSFDSLLSVSLDISLTNQVVTNRSVLNNSSFQGRINIYHSPVCCFISDPVSTRIQFVISLSSEKKIRKYLRL